MKNAFDKKRNATPSRKEAKKVADAKRNATPLRKEAKKVAESKRNAKPSRIQAKNEFDKVRNTRPSRKVAKKFQLINYEKTAARRMYIKERNNKKFVAEILSTLKTETGFDIICSSCLQFKSRHYCKPIECLSNAKVEKFIVNFCSLLKNRTTGQFVCNLCLKDINKNRIPKRSKINLFKFS